MTPQQSEALQQLVSSSSAPDVEDNDMFDDIVNGVEPLSISHAGGELAALVEGQEGLIRW